VTNRREREGGASPGEGDACGVDTLVVREVRRLSLGEQVTTKHGDEAPSVKRSGTLVNYPTSRSENMKRRPTKPRMKKRKVRRRKRRKNRMLQAGVHLTQHFLQLRTGKGCSQSKAGCW
jgi:hypothetical protein